MRAAVGPGLGTCILNKFPSHAAPVGLGLCSESPSTSVENGFWYPLQTPKPTDTQVPSLRDRFVWGLSCVCSASLYVTPNAKPVEMLSSYAALFKEWQGKKTYIQFRHKDTEPTTQG